MYMHSLYIIIHQYDSLYSLVHALSVKLSHDTSTKVTIIASLP